MSRVSVMSGVELYVATPCYGCKLNAAFAACLLQLQGECMRRGIGLSCQLLGNESLVQRARNILIEQFYQSGAKYLLFLDADLAFSPAAIIDRLLPFAREHPDAVVTGVYPKKSYDWSRLNPDNVNEPMHAQAVDYNINIVDTSAKIDNGFVRVLDSATGCMLIPRGVVAKMKAAYSELQCVNDISPGKHPVSEYVAIMDVMIDAESRRYLSEDYAFCRRFQQVGGEIYADLASGMCHIGNYTYEGDIRDRLTMAFKDLDLAAK